MGGAKRAKIPAKQDPKPDPVPLDVETLEKQRAQRRQKIRQRGRQGTILTEGFGSSGNASNQGTLLKELGGQA